jgi:peptidoglycan-N-acetylglucosamine deacetylase
MRPSLRANGNVSVDVDGLYCYRAIHGLENVASGGPDPVWVVGVERARRLFSEFDLRATFFLVGRDLRDALHAETARRLASESHELANHTRDHLYDLRRRSPKEIRDQIRGCDEAIVAATGHSPVGFRTPGYNLSAEILRTSRDLGHRYDASLFPCPSYWAAKEAVMATRRVLGRPSRSDRTDPRALLARRQPYFVDPRRPFRRSEEASGYLEIPVTVAFAGLFPLIGTSLHLLGDRGISRLWPRLNAAFPAYINLAMHALDFLDGGDLAGVADQGRLLQRQPDLRIPWQVKESRYRLVLDHLCKDRAMATIAEACAE